MMNPEKPLQENTLPQNVHVKAVHLVARVFFALTSTTIVVWLIAGIVIPMIAGAMKKGKEYIGYLHSVARHEEQVSMHYRLLLSGGDKERALQMVDYYVAARQIVDRLFPPEKMEQRGLILQQGEGTLSEEFEQQTGKTSSGVLTAVNKKAQEYMDDSFFPVAREILTVFLSRIGVVLSLLVVFLPLLLAAWFIGEAYSRARLKQGYVPKAARFVFFYRLLLVFPPTIFAVPGLPVAMNIYAVIPVLLLLTAVLIFFVRANFIEL
ncbi:MAG: hypothetical protein N3A02_06545 [Rectinema sp.]|nr:hypothetical protein [Rectinema sp.]